MKNILKICVSGIFILSFCGVIMCDENKSVNDDKKVKIESEFELPLMNIDKEKIKELAKDDRNTPIGVFSSALNIWLAAMSEPGKTQSDKNEIMDRAVSKSKKYLPKVYFEKGIQLFKSVPSNKDIEISKEVPSKKNLTLFIAHWIGLDLFSDVLYKLNGSGPYNKINITELSCISENKILIKIENSSNDNEKIPQAQLMIREQGKWKYAGGKECFYGKLIDLIDEPDNTLKTIAKKLMNRNKILEYWKEKGLLLKVRDQIILEKEQKKRELTMEELREIYSRNEKEINSQLIKEGKVTQEEIDNK